MPLRFKRLLLCLIALMLTLPPVFARGEELAPEAWEEVEEDTGEKEEAPLEPGEILVIYPEEADRRRAEDPISAVAEALVSLGHTADYVEARNASGLALNYDKVIWCATAVSPYMDASLLKGYEGHLMVLGQGNALGSLGFSVPEDMEGALIGVCEYAFQDGVIFQASVPLLNSAQLEESDYASGTLEAVDWNLPLVSGRGKLRYLPLVDYSTSFAKAVLRQELAQWLWPYDVPIHTYAEYLVLDAVYPFVNLLRFKDLVEYMVDQKMNFVISVMPIYQNADYPAMKRFAEVLRFAQANGGAVVLHAPIIQNGVEAEELAVQLSAATSAYLALDVYPLGLEIPSEWLFRPDLRSILGGYRTLLLSEMDAFAQHPISEYPLKQHLSKGFQQILPALRLDETGASRLSCYPAAVYLDLGMTEDDQLYAVINAAKDSPIPMRSLWDMEQAVYMNEGSFLTWDRNTLLVNGVQCFNVFTPQEEEPFDYHRNVYYRFVANLAQQNYFLIALSVVLLVIFALLGLSSRRQMHRSFFRSLPHAPKGEKKKNVRS